MKEVQAYLKECGVFFIATTDGDQPHVRAFGFSIVLVALLLCSCGSKDTKGSQSKITAEMAYEGVSNYCHSEYDWSIAKDNPDIMYVQMGEETDSAYQVFFRSYTGAFVNFYVNKASGITRMEEYVPTLDVKTAIKREQNQACLDSAEHEQFRTEFKSDAGTIDIFDYLNKNE